MIRPFMICCILLATAMTSQAQLEAEAYYWLTEIEGDTTVGFKSLTSVSIDVEDDLGYDDDEAVLGARIILGTGHQLGVEYLEAAFEALNQLDRTITFGDQTFTASATLASKVDITSIRGFYRFTMGSEALRGGLVLGGQYVGLEAVAAASGIGVEETDVHAGIPLVGAFLKAKPLPFLGFWGNIVGGSWSYSGYEATYFDAEAAVRLNPLPFVYAGLGYRQFSAEITDKDEIVDFDLSFRGPVGYVGFDW